MKQTRVLLRAEIICRRLYSTPRAVGQGIRLGFFLKHHSYGLLYVSTGLTARRRAVVPENSYSNPYQIPLLMR